MKSTYTLLFFFVFTLGQITPALAGSPAKKLGRGVVNVASAPLEIPLQARRYWKQGAQKTDHILVWILSGVVKGSVNMIARMGSGTWDIVSFPFTVPKDYEPLFKPDTVLQEWQE